MGSGTGLGTLRYTSPPLPSSSRGSPSMLHSLACFAPGDLPARATYPRLPDDSIEPSGAGTQWSSARLLVGVPPNTVALLLPAALPAVGAPMLL